eukprot:gb/GEZN01007705.1/.p1 GENE.gb/GEZN01007705.1/~~gb/GEZN01007705.1/.p1  ORF type:complete len:352 (-),score=52.42 gb/GEZN01007705.1/:455-1489(-)
MSAKKKQKIEQEQDKLLPPFPEKPPCLQYEVLAADAFSEMAERMQKCYPARFRYHRTTWAKFSDGTDNIELGGYTPHNLLRGRNILLLCSFDNNDVTLQQFHAMIVLLQSYISSLTIFLPFYPVATMERVEKEGVIATASTTAQLFCGLPSSGGPIRLMVVVVVAAAAVYDLHTLQNRFYWNQSCVADLRSAIPLLKDFLDKTEVNCIAFPDDGSQKRFGKMFGEYKDQVTCAKKRVGDARIVHVHDGDPKGKHCLIVDDLVRTGGTLFECGQAMLAKGALSISVFCTHALFPQQSWKQFAKGGKKAMFHKFYITNSVPLVSSQLPKDDVFVVFDISAQLIKDL